MSGCVGFTVSSIQLVGKEIVCVCVCVCVCVKAKFPPTYT